LARLPSFGASTSMLVASLSNATMLPSAAIAGARAEPLPIALPVGVMRWFSSVLVPLSLSHR
jgi:hypothetical protein